MKYFAKSSRKFRQNKRKCHKLPLYFFKNKHYFTKLKKSWHIYIDTKVLSNYTFLKQHKRGVKFMKTWTKTLLSGYRYLERLANAIDKIVYTRAINSFYVSGQNLSFNSINLVSDDILNLTERKVSLINLKLILDEALKKLNPKHAELLISVFIECRNCYQSSDELEISLRTFFRRQNEALESFSKILSQLGHTPESFDAILKNENWLLEIKSRYIGNDKHIENGQENIEKKISLPSKNKEKSSFKANLHTQNNLNF